MKITCPDCSTSYEIQAKALGGEGRSVKCAKCGNRWFVSPDDGEDGTIDAVAESETQDDPVSAEDDIDKDEADWAADAAEDEAPPDADSTPDDDEAETAAPMPKSASADEDRFTNDLADDEYDADAPPIDIESQAKRPKIIVNPNKHRRNHLGQLIDWVFRRNFRRIGGIALFAGAITLCSAFILMRDGMVKQSPDLASLFQMIGFDVNLRGLEFRNLRMFNEVEGGKRVLVVEGSIRNMLSDTNDVPSVRLSIRDADMQEVYAWTIEPTTRFLNGFDETRFRTILADPPNDATDIQVRFVDRGKRKVVLE